MLEKQQNRIFSLLNKIIKKHPYMVVIVLHEYFRNLYPTDPHIQFKEKNPIKRISNVQKLLITLIINFKEFGSYKIKFNHKKEKVELKKEIGNFYTKFWEKLGKRENLRTKRFIIERFKNFKSFNKNFFKNKTIIDIGCGGGRYTNALRQLGGKKIIGVDASNESINLAKSNYKYKNLFFKKQDALKLTYSNNSFDIVFCNGVLHHTSNLKKTIKEVVRICKPNGYIYLFLYGKGGIYWPARRKMNKLMKKIPEKYSQDILDLIGMPSNRFIFMDNWYVSAEKHHTHKEVYKILNSLNVRSIEKMMIGTKTDLETGLKKFKNSKQIWGEGEIRILIRK